MKIERREESISGSRMCKGSGVEHSQQAGLRDWTTRTESETECDEAEDIRR